MQILALEKGPAEARWERFRRSATELREVSGPGRGLRDTFYKQIGAEYRTLQEEGAPHPVKTLGEKHFVSISAASRWIKEARRRGHIVDKPAP